VLVPFPGSTSDSYAILVFQLLAKKQILAYPVYHPKSPRSAPLLWTREEFRDAFAEGDYVEFKEGFSEKKIAEALTAFSNADGGIVFFGVANNGVVKHDTGTGEHKAALHRAINMVRSIGRYEFHELAVDDRSIMAISIEPRGSGVAQMVDGRMLVRRGAMNDPLLEPELSALMLARRLHQFDAQEQDVPYEEADRDRVQEVAAAWGWTDETSFPQRLEEKKLLVRSSSRMNLTVAGLLLLHEAPERYLGKAYIEVFRYRRDGEEYDRREQINGPVQKQITEAARFILDELGTDFVVSGMTRHELPRLPEQVVREAIANAVAHREYEHKGQSIRIEMRPGAVTIQSPGGLPEPVTLKNMREQNSARNIHLISTLRALKLAEDAGRGIDVMQDEMVANLLEPPLFDDDNGASVTVSLTPASSASAAERAWLNDLDLMSEVGVEERMLLVHAARDGKLTNASARKLLNADSTHARKLLFALRDSGYLVQEGNRGGAFYVLAAGLAPPAATPVPAHDLRSMILEMAQRGTITNQSVRRAFGIERTDAYAILSQLVDEGQLVREGERRGTRYKLAT
jgi:ATP-dependent DNA helicase RecG